MPRAIERATELGCTAIQIFVKNANQWRGKETPEAEVQEFRAAHEGSAVGPLVAHGSYLINLAATDPAILEKSLDALADELVRCSRLGVAGLVLHPGAHLGAGEEAGIEKVAASLDAVLGDLPDVSTRVLLENTAGQGSCLGWRLEQLAAIRARVAEPHRVGFCLDTCHAFAAGYAIHEEPGFADFLIEVDERLGLAAVGCFHINDSVRPFGSRRDRHAHIGEGEIGLAMFERMLTEPRLQKIPMVVETDPEDEMEGHRRDLNVLRGLVGLKKKRRRRASSPSGRRSG
jgi:deoxyribonuclease-4